MISTDGSNFGGGLAGQANSSTVTESSSSATVTFATAAGGLVGGISGSTVSNSYATGAVTANYGFNDGYDGSGALVGMAFTSSGSATISNSYATGTVTSAKGTDKLGGLLGIVNGAGTPTYTASYWDEATTGHGTTASGTGTTTTTGKVANAAAVTTTLFSTWDTTDVWSVSNGAWPTLRRVATDGSLTCPAVTGASPASTDPAGGATITISGRGFTDATAVTFGGVAATSFSIVSDTTITAVAPAGSGTVAVAVTPAPRSGLTIPSLVLSNALTYAVPVVTPAPSETPAATPTPDPAESRGVSAHTGDADGTSALVTLGLLGLVASGGALLWRQFATGNPTAALLAMPLLAVFLLVRALIAVSDFRLTWLPSTPDRR